MMNMIINSGKNPDLEPASRRKIPTKEHFWSQIKISLAKR